MSPSTYYIKRNQQITQMPNIPFRIAIAILQAGELENWSHKAHNYMRSVEGEPKGREREKKLFESVFVIYLAKI